MRQFDALRTRWIEAERRLDLRAGVLAATAANFSMGKDPDRPPLTPLDFFPSLAELQGEEDEVEPMSFQEIAAVMMSLKQQMKRPSGLSGL